MHGTSNPTSNRLFILKHGSNMRERWVCSDVTGRAVLLTDLAVVALPTVAADALVHTDFVNAGASVAAWVTLAVVDV